METKSREYCPSRDWAGLYGTRTSILGLCPGFLAQIGEHNQNTLEENIPVHRAVAAGRVSDDIVNRATQPFLHYDRFATGVLRFRSYLAQHPGTDLIYAEGVYPFGAMVAASVRGACPKFLVTVVGGDFIASNTAEYGYGRFRVARSLMGYAFRRAAAVRVTTPLAVTVPLHWEPSPNKSRSSRATSPTIAFLRPIERSSPIGVRCARKSQPSTARVTRISSLRLGACCPSRALTLLSARCPTPLRLQAIRVCSSWDRIGTALNTAIIRIISSSLPPNVAWATG